MAPFMPSQKPLAIRGRRVSVHSRSQRQTGDRYVRICSNSKSDRRLSCNRSSATEQSLEVLLVLPTRISACRSYDQGHTRIVSANSSIEGKRRNSKDLEKHPKEGARRFYLTVFRSSVCLCLSSAPAHITRTWISPRKMHWRSGSTILTGLRTYRSRRQFIPFQGANRSLRLTNLERASQSG